MLRTLTLLLLLTLAACDQPAPADQDRRDLGAQPDLGAPDAATDLANDEDRSPDPDLGQPEDLPDALSDDLPNDLPAPEDLASDADADLALAPDADKDLSEPEPLSASQYCETIVDFFCPYYLRCGRMASALTPDACRAVFLETCNSAYEPYYRALESRGALRLDPDGVAACRDHLAQVSCEAQLFDLDGGCAQMWRGLQPEGERCGPGIEGFVCAPGTACRLDTSLCGRCVPAGAPGEPCAEGNQCEAGAACVQGRCVARGAPGDACGDDQPCVLGAGCEAGVCRGFSIVRLGDACDRAMRCPYQSQCVGGVCVEAGLQGQPCTPAGCASGDCVEGVCEAPLQEGDACQEDARCFSRDCAQGACAHPASVCLDL